MIWAGRVGRPCNIDSASLLCNKFLCSKLFLESDYRTAERIHLNHLAVPCGSDSALTVRMMVLLFLMTYIPCSGHLMLLHRIPPQVMTRKPLIMFPRVSMLLNKYRRT
jgi:hypothetical protein